MKIQNNNNNNNTRCKQTNDEWSSAGWSIASIRESLASRDSTFSIFTARERKNKKNLFYGEGFPSDIFWVVVYNYCLFLVVFIVCSISRVTFLLFSLSLALWLVLISRRSAKRQTMPWILPACILNAFDSFLYLSLHLSRVLCVNNTCQQKKKKAPIYLEKINY